MLFYTKESVNDIAERKEGQYPVKEPDFWALDCFVP